MDFLDKQTRELMPDNYDELNHDEKFETHKSVFKWDKYVNELSIKSPENAKYYNPALKAFNNITWENNGWNGREYVKTNLVKYYPEYIPSDQTIEYLISQENILEIGAGNGYWTHVINKNGGECIATDINTPDIDETDSYPITKINDSYTETIWNKILKENHTIIEEYPNHDILFCHPEGLPWTEEVLDIIKPSQKLILVAGWYPSPNATPFFFKNLIDNWNLEKQLPIYRVHSSHAQLYVFSKK